MSKIVSADALRQMLSEEREESYSHPVRSGMPPARGKENLPAGRMGVREISPAKTVQQRVKAPQKTGVTLQVAVSHKTNVFR